MSQMILSPDANGGPGAPGAVTTPLALRVFGQVEGEESRPPLLELVDLRARMYDQ